MGRQAPLVSWHPRGLHGQTSQQDRIGVVATGARPCLKPRPRPLPPCNSGSSCGLFHKEGVASPTQPARSAMGRDTDISEGKKILATQKRDRKGGKETKNRRGLSYGR
ncbi:hypothetical protein E2C01_070752 [Portunus trituberculatus]|uniref:Uncharacterized protein n=1 Tax=Portunus trituberculatus TaxID=210409 RepID=A0A5B7HY56_PORTR|nr:hypothetical protein [Portunus trituberculatus]